MRPRLFRVFSAFLGLGLLLSPAFAQRARQPLPKWEYKIVDYCNRVEPPIELAKLGDEGWELVSTDPGISGEGINSCLRYYLKRPKRTNSPPPPPAKAEAPKCTLGLAQAPTFRGLRLGMIIEEVTALFPAQSEYISSRLKDADQPTRYGLTSLNLSPRLVARQPGQEVRRIGIFEGVTEINLLILDAKVMEISVRFGSYTPYSQFYWTHESLIDRLSTSFNLPGNTVWEKGKGYGERRLTCQGFAVTVMNYTSHYNSNQVISEPVNLTTLTIQDTSLMQVVEQRSQAYQEQRRRAFKF